ncbi:cysteine-rich RLK (RECEPTOR-like protein kinase) 8 [Abeliophyllum distichum]|uniref:Cysteine-rich RLK (RECEPTOR-like protein kinase) 8 n=1 Tax=Abeliophyllum distichum TaxID=126358 RepID=A0ABD1V6L5_9LAMI
MVCRLQKSLYGLKQAPRQWYNKFNSFIGNNDFLRCQASYCCYMKNLSDSYIILLIYVDDLSLARACKQEIDKLKDELSKEIAMKDLGAKKQIIGIRITRDKDVLKLLQEEYAKNVPSIFKMDESKPVILLCLVTSSYPMTVSLYGAGMSLHGQGTLCICYWKSYDCHGVYEIGYSTCNMSCE